MTLPDITWIGSDPENYDDGNYTKIGAILHWMAGGLAGTTSMFRPGGSADYSTGYGIGVIDGKLQIHQYVADNDRAYGSANGDADRRGKSLEIENDRNSPLWPASKPTPEMHQAVAELLAKWAIEGQWKIDGKVQLVLGDFPDHRFYGKAIPDFGVKYNVMTHRSMALKDCPGSTDVVWIVAQANKIINGTSTVVTAEEFIKSFEEDDMGLKAFLYENYRGKKAGEAPDKQVLAWSPETGVINPTVGGIVTLDTVRRITGQLDDKALPIIVSEQRDQLDVLADHLQDIAQAKRAAAEYRAKR